MIWAGHVARIGATRANTFFGKPKERDPSKELGVGGSG